MLILAIISTVHIIMVLMLFSMVSTLSRKTFDLDIHCLGVLDLSEEDS